MRRAWKPWIYKHSWAVAPLAVLLAIGSAVFKGKLGAVMMPVGGAVIAVFYFFQKYQLEELKLLERLFADFNSRYGRMNDDLQRVRTSGAPLTDHDYALLEDYFNLCSEEFFYYDSGVIDSRIWRAWCKGMLQYLDDPRIAEFWAEEEAGDSYYGLTRAKIEAGAGALGSASLERLERAA